MIPKETRALSHFPFSLADSCLEKKTCKLGKCLEFDLKDVW